MLKKCIAIMVVLTVFAGAVFAQVTFGGQLMEGMTLLTGNNVKDEEIMAGGTYGSPQMHEAKFSALFGSGTAGGRLVYEVNNAFVWGWMQWRASQYFRIKIGSDGDGEGGFPQIMGWGFTGEAKNSVAAVNDYNGQLAMSYRNSGVNYGAYDDKNGFHLQLSYFPHDLVAVNFLFRNFGDSEEVSVKLANMQIYSVIKLEQIGTVRFAAVGKGGLAKEQEDGADIGTLHLAFYSNEIVQGLAFEVGGQYNLPHLNTPDTFDAIRLGFGINLTGTEPFNLKVRLGSMFGGQKNGEDIEKVGWSLGLLPCYKISPKIWVFLHTGFGYEQESKDKDAVYDWFVNPYVWMPMGGMRMWIGVQILDQHTKQDGQFGWKIPFGFNFYF